MSSGDKRMFFLVHGQVQGVGFRPFVWRLAHEEKLAGFVRNTSAGVRIEVQGSEAALARFGSRLRGEAPPLARITKLETGAMPSASGESSFSIRKSQGHAGQNVLVSPDMGICADCQADIRQPGNPRHNYPFANCTNCGPRFSITRSIPYDRPFTTMSCFGLCPLCKAEYSDPANRRFHAQPIACPVCGPVIWFVTRADAALGATLPTPANCEDALAKAGSLLLQGGILALRGLGGFQLACDAASRTAVATLRARKERPHKALAIMTPDLETTAKFCELAPGHERELASPRKPIVLCPLRPDAPLAPELAPDSVNLGVMLPYTPLHTLLMDWLCANGRPNPALVMTSANPPGEPITLGNREAIARLDHLADAWLLHNRDILCRVDDSVVAPGEGPEQDTPLFLRRARGYVPEPVDIGIDAPPVLGAGAQLKATFCLTRGREAFLGQHIGDLDSAASMEFYREALEHMGKLLEVTPALVVHDLHPDFSSTLFACELAREKGGQVLALQHHAAHAAACLAENACTGPALALCLDGSGLGTDGAIWGGELLRIDLGQPEWTHLGGLAMFPLPGGEAAIREPWRTALALAWQGGKASPKNRAGAAVLEMLENRVNCPATSSCGRLFDAVSSLLGICDTITYEGQAAMRLEKAARLWLRSHEPEESPDFGQIEICHAGALARLDSCRIFAAAADRLAAGIETGAIAHAFHVCLARHFAGMAAEAARNLGIAKVALTGGVMQNGLLAAMLSQYLRASSLQPLSHRLVPPGDGGIALGQAAWGARFLARSRQGPC